MIVLEDVHKKLGGVEVLQGVSFCVNPGETYVIIGQSGEGKTVTLKNIIGLIKPDRGRITVADKDLSKIKGKDLYELRNMMGILFQTGALIAWMNVGENVALPLIEHESMSRGEANRIVKEKLALVNLKGIEGYMPSDLSGGMRKRVGLARAIVRNPRIILYDEPTSGLDPVMSHQIDELIISLQKKLGVTSICVTHDMTSAYRIANRIGMLYKGKIIEEGTPEEIQKTRNTIVRQFIEGRTKGPLTDEKYEISG